MIRIRRAPEGDACPELSAVREAELGRVRETVRQGAAPDQKLLRTEYKVARQALFEGHYYKCCYCEERQQDARWEHVEHFRPKAEARRSDDAPPETGYWWLTWSWDNLLFSCIRCNHAKGSKFPLLTGSSALVAEQTPPGSEQPELIDPASTGEGEDPRAHIQFRPFGEHWIPSARTPRGTAMLAAVGLGLSPDHERHRVGLQQEWDDHASSMRPAIAAIEQALESNDPGRARAVWEKQTRPFRAASQRFVALALDVLDHHFPAHVRGRWGLSLEIHYP